MSDMVIPSYRVRPERAPAPWRIVAIAGGLFAAFALGGAIAWGLGGSAAGPAGAVPVIEADARPVKVRPEQRGGLAVANTDQLVLDSPAARRAAEAQATNRVRPLNEPEAPALDALRREAAPVAAPVAAVPAPVAVAQPVAIAPPAATTPGRAAVQLGALPTEASAREEWARLARKVPELAGRQPQITRLDREGRGPVWRIRTGGLADADAARTLCDQVRAGGGACMAVGG